MATNCPQCGQPALPSDVVCWHCGHALQPTSTTAASPAETPITHMSSKVYWYGGIAILMLIVLLATTGALRRQPLVIYNATIAYQPGWRPFTDNRRQFTLEMPPRWQTSEKPIGAAAAAWADTRHFAATLRPLQATTSQADLRLILTSNQLLDEAPEAGFVMVTWMPELAKFAPGEILQFVQAAASDIAFQDGELITGIHGTEQPFYLFRVTDDGVELECLQQVTAAYNTSYLVTACAPRQQFRRYSDDFASILQTFQILEPR